LFLGGYLLNPSVLMQLAALVVWLGKTSVATERPDDGAVERRGGFAIYSDTTVLGTR
jgi:hypothetical protein